MDISKTLSAVGALILLSGCAAMAELQARHNENLSMQAQDACIMRGVQPGSEQFGACVRLFRGLIFSEQLESNRVMKQAMGDSSQRVLDRQEDLRRYERGVHCTERWGDGVRRVDCY